VIRQERDHVAAREPLDDLDRVLAELALEDAAHTSDEIFLALLGQGLLGLDHRVAQDHCHQVVLQIRPRVAGPAPDVILEERDHCPRNLPREIPLFLDRRDGRLGLGGRHHRKR
jgi:hypothetical protein